MKPVEATLTLVVIALASIASGSAFAHHHGGHHHGGHVRFGVFVGAPFYWYPPPYYYYPSPYYYPPAVTVPYSPPVYIEQGGAQPAPAQSQVNWWYYCADAKTYYPYIKQCPGGWQRVAPQPPPG